MNLDFFFKAPQEVVVSCFLNIFFVSFVFYENYNIGGLYVIVGLLLILLVYVFSLFLLNLNNIARKAMLFLVEIVVGISVLLLIYFIIYYDINNLILILLILVYGPYEVYLFGYNKEVLQAYKK